MDNLNLANKNINLDNNSEDFNFEIEQLEKVDLNAVDSTVEIVETTSDDINAVEVSTDTTLEAEVKKDNNSEECTALVEVKSNSLWVAQKMFKKSIKISIKSFLISLSLGFLNLFF